MEFFSSDFWMAVLQIIAIDLLLSGDNAVVIALACRNLPEAQRKKGVLWGVVGAITLRVALTAFAASVLAFPYLKLTGGALLLWIGVRLLLPEEGADRDIPASAHLAGAVQTIVVADLVMSLDNVIGVAAAAKGSLFLLLFGLAVSIPLIVWSSHLMLKFMERFPIVVTLGAGLLGYVAGGMIVSDAALQDWVQDSIPAARQLVGAAGALLVVAIGLGLAKHRAAATDHRVI